MELKINLITCNSCDSCKVTVQDTSTYLPEDNIGTVKGKFKFSDTVSIDVLQLNKPQDVTYLNPTFTEHSSLEQTTLEITSDGWYSLVHLVLPSQDWFNKELSKQEGSALGLYNIVYFASNNNFNSFFISYIAGSVIVCKTQ